MAMASSQQLSKETSFCFLTLEFYPINHVVLEPSDMFKTSVFLHVVASRIVLPYYFGHKDAMKMTFFS